MELQPTWREGLTPELRKKAEAELGETPEKQSEALLELRKLINEDANVYIPEDDKFLTRFLRVKKYNTARTFKTLKNYYAFKGKFPGLLTEKIKTVLGMNHYFTSPLRAPDGGTIFTAFFGQFDFQKFTIEDYFDAGVFCGEQIAETDADQICGTHTILDLKGMTFKKLMAFCSPSFAQSCVKGVEECWPHRVISIHVVNEPFYMSIAMNLFSPMFSKKVRERFIFHGSNLSRLHKSFPPEVLPTQLGGTCGEDAFKHSRETIISRHMEIEKLDKYSFHRRQKPVKKHSTCGLEDHSPSLMNKNSAVSNIAS